MSGAASLRLRLSLLALEQFERRGLNQAATSGYRRLRDTLPTDPASRALRRPIAEALLRLGLSSDDPTAFAEACADWRSLEIARDEERLARAGFRDVLRRAIAATRAGDARTLAEAECARAPAHAAARYALGCLAELQGDERAALEAFTVAERSKDERLASAAASRRVAIDAGPRTAARDAETHRLSPRARLELARRFSRSGGRYRRVRGLDLLIDLAREGHDGPAVLRVAAEHLDRNGPRLTAIEGDRLQELLRLSAPAAELVDVFRQRIALLRKLAEQSGEERLTSFATELGGSVGDLVRSLRRSPSRVYPVPSETRLALACETLRVCDALRAGEPATFDRLLQLFEEAGPQAASVSTLWALIPCYVQRHAELGMARDRLRPLLLAAIADGPACSLDLATTARALEVLGEEALAEGAARRAADQGDGAPLAERWVRRAWALADHAPEEALRLLEGARALA